MVEEVHHHTAPPKLFEHGECLFDSSAEGRLVDPCPEAHIFGIGVLTNGRQIETAARPCYVGVRPWLGAWFGLLIPRRDGVFGRGERVRRDTVAGAEIDVSLRHSERKNWLTGLAVVNVAVPPGKSDLARLDPRCVRQSRRFIQTVNRFRFEQCAWTVGE